MLDALMQTFNISFMPADIAANTNWLPLMQEQSSSGSQHKDMWQV